MTQASGKVQLRVAWGKCTGDSWCGLNNVNLTNSVFDKGGVYLIWYQGSPGRVVYVGQATKFRDRLAAHRSDPRIQQYASRGLLVTWASVQAAQRDGVEVYLADRFSPLVGDRHPSATPISVNSPWD